MIDDPRRDDQQPDGDAPANPFADLQSKVEGISLNATLRGYDDTVALPEDAPPRDAAPADPLRPAMPAAAAPGAAVPAGAAPQERLCPSCNAVRKVQGGRCVSCGHSFAVAPPLGGPPLREDAAHPAYTAAYEAPQPRVGLYALVIVLLLALGAAAWFFVVPLLREDAAEEVELATAQPGAGAVGGVQAVSFDDVFRERVEAAFVQANTNLATGNVDAYIYRVALREVAIPGTSQDVHVNAYVGGPQHQQVIEGDSKALVETALSGLMTDLEKRSGVTGFLDLHPPTNELPDSRDFYVVYGKHYGQEHWEEISEIVTALTAYREREGRYPLELPGSLLTGLRTLGGPAYISGGYGYIPIFRTDGVGNIVMGTGAGLDRLQPAEVTGYFLLVFLDDAARGLDFYSPADLQYHVQNISPFPYSPKGPVRNMPLNPDGKPDGIGAVVKSGELMDY